MDRLLEIASVVSDQAEVYHVETNQTSIVVRDGELDEVFSTIQSGYSLRIIKSGKLGSAYTKNLHDREELIQNARLSMERGVEVAFDFPQAPAAAAFDQYHDDVAHLKASDLYGKTQEALGFLQRRVSGQVNLGASATVKKYSVKNSTGLDVAQANSTYEVVSEILYPNTETGVSLHHASIEPSSIRRELLERTVDLFEAGLPEVDIPTGRMIAVFSPETMYSLMWRLEAAANGRAFYEQISPVLAKQGEKIFSERLSIVNDPLDRQRINARCFDDEGVPTRRLSLIEQGVFLGPFVSLDYASKLGTDPTGTGFRSDRWGGDEITFPPIPHLSHLSIEPGTESLQEIVRSIQRGVLIFGVLGAHSGNILNGDFSMGLNPGLYVENGEIRGRLKDAMIAGNVYDMMKQVVMVENDVRHSPGGYFPSVAFAEVNVSTRG